MSAFEVLIVGGGPVGLALAIELGMRGVRTLLVERRDGSITIPKMNAVNSRGMEFCRRWGVAERVKQVGWPQDYENNIVFVTALAGYELYKYSYPSYRSRGEVPYTPEGSRRCSQLLFDPILRERADALSGVTLRYGTQLDEFVEDEESVRARLVDAETGRVDWVSVRYLVGCDGADSTIRAALGIAMEGSSHINSNLNILFTSPNLYAVHDKGQAWAHWIVGPEGCWSNIVAVDGRSMFRLSMRGGRGSDMNAVDAAAAVRRAVGTEFRFDIKAVFPWDRRQQVAARYRKGRVFLAGDSVHVMSPTGGLGMNTGLADAVDLAWKLAAVLRGWGAAGLLASYEIERRPVARHNVDEATENFRLINSLPTGPEIASATEAGARLRQHIHETIDANAHYREQYEQEGTVLGYDYDGSPIIVSEPTSALPFDPKTYFPTARPGHRAPHGWIAPGHSIIDEFGDGFVLLRFPGGPQAQSLEHAFRTRGVPLVVRDIGDAALAELYTRRLVLVRPDGHVAWRSDELPTDPLELADIVRGAPHRDAP